MRPPHSTVLCAFTEIETIYRVDQVLLLQRLRTWNEPRVGNWREGA